MKLGSLPARDVAARLADPGLYLPLGPFLVRATITAPGLADALRLLYADFPVVETDAIADFHVGVSSPRGPRRRFRPQARFGLDGLEPFQPSPAALGIALFEWGLNWCVGFHAHGFLVMHSAVVERGGRAAILPGVPGAGKSTLCAALVNRGWRLLSDEFALLRLDDGRLAPLPRPVSLKNESIDIIRRFAPDVVMGPLCTETHKGTVAHMRPPAPSVERMHEPAEPAWIVFPRYAAGAAARLEPLAGARTLMRVADNCFNHSLGGARGFLTLADLVESCGLFDLTYAALDDAVAIFDALVPPRPARPPRPDAARRPALDTPRRPAGPSGAAALVADQPLLLQALRSLAVLPRLSPAQWDLLLRQGRRSRLLGRLGARAEAAGLLDQVPERAAAQLRGARAFADHQHQLARWEVNRVRRALAGTGIPITLLKGTAYVMADLPPGHGRLFSDVDFMVTKDDLPAVEAALLAHGWVGAKLDPYDQRYYRTWMHELPPLHHPDRQTSLDVHHTILPESSRLRPDPRALLESARPLKDPLVRVLAPTDMVLHTSVHLFQDGDLQGGLQDLLDIDGLLRHFAGEEGFWDGLVPRAVRLGLERPLFYALRYAERILDTPVPAHVRKAAAAGRPAAAVRSAMDALVTRALAPPDLERADPAGDAARWLLYVRSHWLRMPPLLLARHLGHQALRRLPGRAETSGG